MSLLPHLRKALNVTLLVASFASLSSAAWEYEGYQNSQRSRFGLEFQRFKGGNTDSGTQGWMVGIRQSYYPTHGIFNLGYQLDFGSPHAAASVQKDNLFYGGLTLGVDSTFAKIFTYDLGCLVGYGFGNIAAQGLSGQSIALQPTASLGFVLVDGYRVSFSPGYLYMPMANGFSGFTFGIRLERKIDSLPGLGVDK